MATNTYVTLDTKTVSTATPSVTFTNIPTTYTDLVMVINGGLSAVNQSFRFQVGNGTLDTGNNYSYTYMAANGSTNPSGRASTTNGFNVYHLSGQSDANIKNSAILHFQNYSSTTANKTIICRGSSDLETAATVALWRGTSAINTIIVGTTSGNLVAGTTISLYGIKAVGGDSTPKATGGIVTSDATYYYHTFLGSSTFTPLQSLTADVLVIAGGGGGGTNGGGGGAGGLLALSSQSLTATPNICLVGAGGTGVAGAYPAGTSGANSIFGTSNAIGGGGGGGANAAPLSGGSGGGGGWGLGAYSGGAGTAGQGNAGGSYPGSGSWGGGGGGAGTAGTAGGGGGGTGGNGVNTYASWATATGTGVSGYYAGGGGGGGTTTGGLGGGANGTPNNTPIPTPAIVNTGSGGGGGGGGAGTGGNGASGIIIVRYAK